MAVKDEDKEGWTIRAGQRGQRALNMEIVGKLAPSATASLSVSRISYKPLQKELSSKNHIKLRLGGVFYISFHPSVDCNPEQSQGLTSHWDLQRLRSTSLFYLDLKTEGG